MNWKLQMRVSAFRCGSGGRWQLSRRMCNILVYTKTNRTYTHSQRFQFILLHIIILRFWIFVFRSIDIGHWNVGNVRRVACEKVVRARIIYRLRSIPNRTVRFQFWISALLPSLCSGACSLEGFSDHTIENVCKWNRRMEILFNFIAACDVFCTVRLFPILIVRMPRSEE